MRNSTFTASVLPLHGLVLAADDGLVVEANVAFVGAVAQAVLHPVGVVARRVVVAEMGAPALGAGQGADDERLGQVDEEAQLDRLGEVVVEDLALVLDRDPAETLAEAAHSVEHGPQTL